MPACHQGTSGRIQSMRGGYVGGMHERRGGDRLGRRVGRVAEAVGRGLAAGVAGTAVMTASSALEMKLRGREPSTAPASAMGRVLGRPFLSGFRSVTVDVAGVRRPIAALPATFAVVMTPEVLLAPALGATDPPWRWGLAETAISATHHVAWAAGTEAAYRALSP
jgi:hypothetical protein